MTRHAIALCVALFALDARAALSQAEAQASVAAVLPELTAIRGFTFVRTVPVTVIDDAQARTYALARFHRMTPESKIRADQTVYRLLGLVPEDVDVVGTLLDVLEEQAGGFYDPETKAFYLLDDMPKAMTALLTAHEMTHALDDQRYDIDGRLMKAGDDDDASFALSAVAEGGATIASAVYLAAASASGKIAADDLAAAGDMEQIRTERLNAMPPVMRRQLLGPYLLGMSFLLRGRPDTLGEGFPKADVNAAWEHPPRSSEQILHPEKYWDAAKRDGVEKLVRFERQDATKARITGATALLLYLLPESLEALAPVFERDLAPGVRIVSHDYKIPGWDGRIVLTETMPGDGARDHRVILYRMPEER
jgi:hypothetical protein